jgi:hypothetical protein
MKPALAEVAIRIALVGAALIHLLPLPGVLGGEWLVKLYGIAVPDAGSEFLLRHRAIVFGLMGLALLAALAIRPWRLPFVLFVLASDLAFLLIAAVDWPQSTALQRVIAFDGLSVALLMLVLVSDSPRKAGS